MPLAAPVTTATLPWMSMVGFLKHVPENCPEKSLTLRKF